MNLRLIPRQLLDAAIVLYSLVVIAGVAPSFQGLSTIGLVPYYLVVPGYALTSVLSESPGPLGRGFYSVVASLALVASVSSLQSITSGSVSLPLGIVIPVLTLAFFAFGHFHKV